jgi:TP901 family phage tail tape measure protein
MANTRLNFDINFRTRGNFGPLSQGLNQLRGQSAAAFGAMTTPAIRSKSAIDGLSASLQKKRLTLNQTRVALRNTNSILREHNALVGASALVYKNAAGAGKTYLTVNRALAASTVTLNQRLRYTATVLNAASTSLINFGKNVQWAGRQVMMGLTLPLLLLGSAASKAAEEFDRQLVRVVKVTNLSVFKIKKDLQDLNSEMVELFDVSDQSERAQQRVAMMGDLIRDQARALAEFGANIGFAAEETGKISAEFAQMGYQGFALDGLTKQALTLSRISGTDLNDSIQLVRLTVQAFGNDIADLTEKFARLNIIENNTALSLQEMAQGIPVVASVANELGIEIEYLAGMLAVMKEKGITAREGATALRTGLIQLIQKPTRNAVEAFKMINVELDQMQERHRGDIIGFFNELSTTMTSLEGSGRQGQANLEMFTQALATLTGVRASARFLSLVKEMGSLEKVFDENLGKEVWRVKEGIEESSLAARAFINTLMSSEKAIAVYKYELDQVNNSLSGIRDRLKAQLNVELQKMGERFLIVGNQVRAAINNVLRAFNNLDPGVQSVIFSIGTFLAVLGPVTMFLGIFANALGQIAKGVTFLLPRMTLMTAAQVAEARATQHTNNQLVTNMALKEGLISTNMRLAASMNTLSAASVGNIIATHGTFGITSLPMSIDPNRTPAEARRAAGAVAGQKMRTAAKAGDPLAKQLTSASRIAGASAAAAMLVPNLTRVMPGANVGLLASKGPGGRSIAQLMQQELEQRTLRVRNEAIQAGIIGTSASTGKRLYGAPLESQFQKHLRNIGYSPEAQMRDAALRAAHTGTIAGQVIDPNVFRQSMGMAPALAAGTAVSGTRISSRMGMHRQERLFTLAEQQRQGASIGQQRATQERMLRQRAQDLRMDAARTEQYVARNMPAHLRTSQGAGILAAEGVRASRFTARQRAGSAARRFGMGVTGAGLSLAPTASRAAVTAANAARLGSEFDELARMGQVPEGMTRQQYVDRGVAQTSGAKGRVREFRAARRGITGPVTTSFMQGAQRGGQAATYISRAATAMLLMPLKAPFQAIGKLGQVAGKGLGALVAKGGLLGKGAGAIMGAKGLAMGGLGFLAGGAAALAIPLTIVFGTLAMANRKEFMEGLMSTLSAPLSRLRGAWDSLTERIQYLRYLFRNLRGDGTGVFAAISTFVGKLVGFIAGKFADALTSIMTIFQSIFSFIEGLIKLFSGDFSGAMSAFGDSFKLLGIAILEIILNIIDAIVGWIPGLSRVIAKTKEVVAGWREGITAIDDTTKALMELDQVYRNSLRSSETLADDVDKVNQQIRGWLRFGAIEQSELDDIEAKFESILSTLQLDPSAENISDVWEEAVGELADYVMKIEGLPDQMKGVLVQHAVFNHALEMSNNLQEDLKNTMDAINGVQRVLTSEEEARLAVIEEQIAEQTHLQDMLEKTTGFSAWRFPQREAIEFVRNIDEAFLTVDNRLSKAGKDYLKTVKDGLSELASEQESLTLTDLERRQSALEQVQEDEKDAIETVESLRAQLRNAQDQATVNFLQGQLELELLNLQTVQEEKIRLAQEIKNIEIAGEDALTNYRLRNETRVRLEQMRNARQDTADRMRTVERGSEEWRRLNTSLNLTDAYISRLQRDLENYGSVGLGAIASNAENINRIIDSSAERIQDIMEQIALANARFAEEEGDAPDLGQTTEDDTSNVVSAVRSAMNEMMGDIRAAVSRVISEQTRRISDHFKAISDRSKEYFDNYLQSLTEQTRAIVDQLEERAEAEEQAINSVADARLEYIDEQRKREQELDDARERFFRREQARIDYIRSRRTTDVQIREASLRGEFGRAAILQIEREISAQEYYNEILKEREGDVRRLRDLAREEQIERIEQEREEALAANRERIEIEKIAVEEAEKQAREAAKIAQERAEKEIEAAVEAAEKAREAEQFRIDQYLREWQNVTPATEEEFQKHLSELNKFMDQSGIRLRAEINAINASVNKSLASISKDFQSSNNAVITELQARLSAVETQYLETSNNILQDIHNTNVSVANSLDDILTNIGNSATTVEKDLAAAREAFAISITGMLDELNMAGEETLNMFITSFIPEFTTGLQSGFANATDIYNDFLLMFGHDMRKGFETAIDRAIAALTEEAKWKAAQAAIAAHVANLASTLNLNLGGGNDQPTPTPGGNEAPWWGNEDASRTWTGPFAEGARGEQVRHLQRNLNQALPGFANLSVDGIYGPQTLRAVQEFKRRNSLANPTTGAIDFTFWDRLWGQMHTGGLVGSAMAKHSGELKNDEVATILQKGEYVISKGAVASIGTGFLDKINSVQARFSSPSASFGTLRSPGGGSSMSTSNTYNLSFHVDGGNIDESRLAQKVVFEIKKMERSAGGGRRMAT